MKLDTTINLDLFEKKQQTADVFDFEPTQEQKDIVQEFAIDLSPCTCVQAGAGASKTTTLLLVADALGKQGRRGHYTAFNKLIVEEGKQKFDKNHVKVSTIHSLAYHATSRPMRKRLNSKRMYKSQISGFIKAEQLSVKLKVGDSDAYKVLSKIDVVTIADLTVTNFCNSADKLIEEKHVPVIRKFGKQSPEVNQQIRKQLQDKIVLYANKLWGDIINPNGVTPFKHQHYLKIWELGNPIVDCDYLAIDEAQDLNPVMLSIAEKNSAAGVRVILVGDSSQSIYSFTGAIDALDYVTNKGVKSLPLSKSFRFGQPIADVANKFLKQLKVDSITGGAAHKSDSNGQFNEFYDNADALLVKTNAGGLQAFMKCSNDTRAVHLNVDVNEIYSIIDGIEALKAGETPEHYELINYTNFEELVEDINNDAADYQVTLIFEAMKKYTGKMIKYKLYNMASKDSCDLHILTAHKSKGCEWDRVAIFTDFALSDKAIQEATSFPYEYLRLCYVAVTRARKVLDWSALYDFEDRLELIRANLGELHENNAANTI